MNSRDFNVELDLIRDRKSSSAERMSAIQHIHLAVKREYEAGLQSARDINRLLEDVENIAHNAIDDSVFVHYYCAYFPVSEFFLSRLMERKGAAHELYESITSAIVKNNKLQSKPIMQLYSKLLMENENLPEALRFIDWAINRSLSIKSDSETILYMLNNLVKNKCDEVVSFIREHESSLIKLFEEKYHRNSHQALECGIEFYDIGCIELGHLFVQDSHAQARISTLTRYEKSTGDIITPELAFERHYDSLALISYWVDNPDQLKKFKGKELPSYGFEIYKFQNYFNSCKTKQDRSSFVTAMIMLATQWSGSLGDLHGIIHLIKTSDPLKDKKYLAGIFKSQAPRYYKSIPKLIELINLISLAGLKIKVNLSDKLLRAELDKLLIGVSLPALREAISLDPSMKVLDRACIIDAIERNWEGWSERERDDLKSKATAWIVEGARPLQKMRLERDLGM